MSEQKDDKQLEKEWKEKLKGFREGNVKFVDFSFDELVFVASQDVDFKGRECDFARLQSFNELDRLTDKLIKEAEDYMNFITKEVFPASRNRSFGSILLRLTSLDIKKNALPTFREITALADEINFSGMNGDEPIFDDGLYISRISMEFCIFDIWTD